MRRLAGLLGYWIAASATALALFGIGLPYARLLAPVGRVVLLGGPGGWTGLRQWRRWAEAVTLAWVWGGVPWLLGLLLQNARLSLPWMGEPYAGGSAAWWWVGVALYFALLYRRMGAGLVAGVLALAWQWIAFSREAFEFLQPYVGQPALSYVIFGLFMGLVLGLADGLGGWWPGRGHAEARGGSLG